VYPPFGQLTNLHPGATMRAIQMATADPAGSSPKGHDSRRIAVAVVRTQALMLVLLIVGGLVAFFGVGRWLVVENPLEKAQAIVVLSGAMPMRALQAARLYHEGYAPQIWLTHPEQPAASLDSMEIPNSGEDYFNSRVLAHEGVPAAAIRILEPKINNTADEIRAVAAELARESGSVVIIITTKAHTRRVARLWRQLAAGRGRAVIRAARADPFDPAHWWRNTRDVLDVLREVLGLLNSWAGLPLHPPLAVAPDIYTRSPLGLTYRQCTSRRCTSVATARTVIPTPVTAPAVAGAEGTAFPSSAYSVSTEPRLERAGQSPPIRVLASLRSAHSVQADRRFLETI
jgi:uncharacterized SAM-binding protein YcdF (DUF218 family)